jgi:hypothetical protein
MVSSNRAGDPQVIAQSAGPQDLCHAFDTAISTKTGNPGIVADLICSKLFHSATVRAD